MTKVRALNRDGEITWCTAKTPGHGNCNHVLHQTGDMTEREFQKQIDKYNETMTKKMYSDYEYERVECAESGYGLDVLINDWSPEVREAVARNGYRLDKLVDDPDEYVRAMIAMQGKHLDKLINDPSPLVRRAVAKQDYGLEILKDDLSSIVRNCAIKRLEEAKHVFTTDDIADAFIKDPDIKADILHGLNADGGKLYWAKFSTGAFGKRATKILKGPLEWANIKLKDGQATVILQKIICTLEKEGYKWREGPNDTTEFAKD